MVMRDDELFSPLAWEGVSLEEAAYTVDIQEDIAACLRKAVFRADLVGDHWASGLEEFLEDCRTRIGHLGFVVCRNWPLAPEDADTAGSFAAFGSLLGTVRAQDGAREWWRFVEDRSGTSGSSGRMDIALHTENARPPGPPRYISLLCVRAAASGGASVIASGPAVWQKMHAEHGHHLCELRSLVPFGRRREDWADGREFDRQAVFGSDDLPFHLRYSRYWIDLALSQSSVKITPEVAAALDVLDSILDGPALPLRFILRPGEAVLIDNRVVMHGRDAFDDAPGTARRLVRIWID
jgi:hypothetical protein